MARDLTPFIIQSLTPQGDDGSVTMVRPHIAFDIKLKDEAGTVLRWATGDVTVDSINVMGVSTAFGPFAYTDVVREVPNVRFTQAHAPDGGTFSTQNVDNLIGEVVGGLEAVFTGADVTMHYLFLKANGNYEADTIFVGRCKSAKKDKGQPTCTFIVVSDVNDKAAVVAGRSLTQKCWWGTYGGYKGPGCRYPGPEPTCSLVKEDAVNGCRAKAWEFAFGGADFEIVLPTRGSGFGYDDVDGFPGPGGGTYFGPGGVGPGRPERPGRILPTDIAL
jgi:hypothetical protein